MDPYSSGFDLWVLPDRNHSDWAAHLDWYLQFQISKSQNHQPAKPSVELEEMAKTAEVDLLKATESRNAPLLIGSSELLPNRLVLHVPYHQDLKQWLVQIENIWKNLQEPTVRLFLPNGKGKSDLPSKGPRFLSGADVVDSSIPQGLFR